MGFELTTMYGDQAAFVSAGGYHHHKRASRNSISLMGFNEDVNVYSLRKAH